jgi:hypothetical protein
VLPPDVRPLATGHLLEMQELITALIDAGKAYAVDGDVFFRVRSFPAYGALSNRRIDDLVEGADVVDRDRKEDPLDFALWKSAKPDEPSWPSPWGPGRPGWHIECSAMAATHLGAGFDIHGGGLDLVFPHHENEIAQHEAAHGTTFARHWVHNGMVQMGDAKMSKSVGNVVALADAVAPSAAVRCACGTCRRTTAARSPSTTSGSTTRAVFQRFVTFVRAARRAAGDVAADGSSGCAAPRRVHRGDGRRPERARRRVGAAPARHRRRVTAQGGDAKGDPPRRLRSRTSPTRSCARRRRARARHRRGARAGSVLEERIAPLVAGELELRAQARAARTSPRPTRSVTGSPPPASSSRTPRPVPSGTRLRRCGTPRERRAVAPRGASGRSPVRLASRSGARSGAARPQRVVHGIHPVRELLRAARPVREIVIAAARGGSGPVAEIEALAAAAGGPGPRGRARGSSSASLPARSTRGSSRSPRRSRSSTSTGCSPTRRRRADRRCSSRRRGHRPAQPRFDRADRGGGRGARAGAARPAQRTDHAGRREGCGRGARPSAGGGGDEPRAHAGRAREARRVVTRSGRWSGR